ncbi:ACP phosphodiesterase [Alteromonas flava]|uniref:acyl carrier protein phosphodiesterase n=1 Tax=Alteromonas flava TaxID=2048003 RepID=UPI0030B840F7
MNYLAHIHMAHVSQTSLVGNFLGDFVKGSDLTRFPHELQTGIRLHRAIDSYTDSHPVISQLREHFPPALRRMSGIIIDVYFDHLLCRHWSRIESTQLEHVLAKFYAEINTTNVQLNSRF